MVPKLSVGFNFAAPAAYQPAQFANRMLVADPRMTGPTGKPAPVGPDGWPVGPGLVSFNCNLDSIEKTPISYTLIMLQGSATALDVNQGLGNGGHVAGKVDGKLITFTANGIPGGSVPFWITLTSTGKSEWALVRTDELDAYRADPEALSPSWLAKFKRVKHGRVMDWLDTNHNLTPGYTDPDPARPAAFMGRVPLRAVVKLVEQTGIQPTIPIPVASNDDGVRAFVSAFASLVYAGRKPKFDFGNEVWNLEFKANGYAILQEIALIAAGKLPADAKPTGMKWYGYRAAQVSRILQSMGWKLRRDFEMAIGCFTNAPEQEALVWAGVAAAGGTDADFSRWSISSYIHGDFMSDFAKTVAMVKAGDVGPVIDTILHGPVSSVDWASTKILPKHAIIAAKHGLALDVYEAGTSFRLLPYFGDTALKQKGAGITEAQVIDFTKKVLVDPRIAGVTTANLTACNMAGVDVLYHFDDQTRWDESGFWGSYGTPVWDAIMAWNAQPKDDLASISSALADVTARLNAWIEADTLH